MHYGQTVKSIRKRKHIVTLSLIISLLIAVLIVIAGFTILDAKQFFLGFTQSFIRVCLAYAISLFLAILLGLLTTSSEKIEGATFPIFDVLQSFPSFALYPLFALWFGKTSIVTIIILVFEMVWPLLFTFITAHKQIRQEFYEAAQAYGATGTKYIFYVLFPLMFPAFVTGSLIAWGEAWEAIIAAELLIDIPGVGTYLGSASEAGQTQILAIGILALLLILFLFNKYIWLSLLNMSTKYQQ